MRHRKKTVKLNRHSSHRKALLSNLVRSLFLHEAINTTVAKAKAAQPLAEKMISLGKKKDVASQRRAVAILHDKSVVKKLFSEIAPKFAERTGGYTRLVRTTFRHGDGAEMGILELVGRQVEPKQVEVPEKVAKAKGKPAAADSEKEPAKKPEKKAEKAKAASK